MQSSAGTLFCVDRALLLLIPVPACSWPLSPAAGHATRSSIGHAVEARRLTVRELAQILELRNAPTPCRTQSHPKVPQTLRFDFHCLTTV
jgi:hypothetical protein